MDSHRLSENERRQMEQIRELDFEELQIEEVDDDFISSSDDDNQVIASGRNDEGGFTFNTCLASLHTYLGEVDDIRGRLAFLDGGAIMNLPMFYLEGVVLFPQSTLPLRVIQPRFKAAVERALQQVDAPCTIGVVRVHRHPHDESIRFATTGTTAEIRQYRQLDDGSLNVVARGRQRFRLRRRWIDVEGAPCAEVQIVCEDAPLRTPKDVCGQLASDRNSRKFSFSHSVPSDMSPHRQSEYDDAENSFECMSFASTGSDNSYICMRMSPSASSSEMRMGINESSSSNDELICGRRQRQRKAPSSRLEGSIRSCKKTGEGNRLSWDILESSPEKRSSDSNTRKSGLIVNGAKCMRGAPVTFWPPWVYQMYDSYALARRAADLWGQIIGSPKLDDHTKRPDLLSFYIGSKLPVSESRRQELLEIDGISYRLQKEIQFLKSFNLIRCKNCLTLIAKRTDMLVMSSDGPLNAYVNPHGYVHEIITVYNASGLSLQMIRCESVFKLEGETSMPYCSRAEMYDIAHKKKDGSFVNDEAKEKSEELRMQSQTYSEEVAYINVFGKEHSGHVRGMGFGVCPSQVFGSSSRSGGGSSGGGPSQAEYDALLSRMQEMENTLSILVKLSEPQVLSISPNISQANGVGSQAQQ